MNEENEKSRILEDIADIVTDFLFCDDENEKDYCEQILYRKLERLGYVEKDREEGHGFLWSATDKSTHLKEFLEK